MSRVLGIDASLAATGVCVLDDFETKPLHLSTIRNEDLDFTRLADTARRVLLLVDEFQPELVAMEGYAYGASSNTITQLAELGGIIKLGLSERGYAFGIGTGNNKASRDQAIMNTKTQKKLFVVQTVASMKKFCLGHGSMKKDSGYLLSVYKRMHIEFEDDNQADAYMHAWSAQLIVSVLLGHARIGDLEPYQQESLISAAVKNTKGLSLTKAMKLSDDQKMKLVQL